MKPRARNKPPGASIPRKAGASGCGGDIGTHAYEFVRFVAGRSATRIRARLKAFVPGRALDDDFTVLAELDNGGIATIAASQITIGAQNDNGFRVSGTTGTLEWSITDHTNLKHYAGGQPFKLYRQGAEYGYFPGSIKPYLRLPSGHPEGFHEALANLHRTLEWTIRGRRGETVPTPFDHPGIADGVAGMAFVEAAVASSQKDGAVGGIAESRLMTRHGQWWRFRRWEPGESEPSKTTLLATGLTDLKMSTTCH